MFSARDHIRFWSKVQISAGGCAEWRGATCRSGYGEFYFQGRNHPAHRVSWMIEHGQISDPELYVLHRCDNRLCVEPAHLFVGTHQDNMDDMQRKGRRVSLAGVAHPRARLTPEQVASIRSDPRSYRVLGAEFGVSKTQIGNIKRGTSWRCQFLGEQT